MGKLWLLLLRAVGWLGDIQAVWAIVPAGVLAAVSGLSAYFAEGLHWAIFISTGVLCFFTVFYLIARESYRGNRLEQKLNIAGFNMTQHPTGEGLVSFRPSFVLQNLAGFPVYFEVKLAAFSFGAIQGQKDPTVVLNGLVAPRDTGSLVLPAVAASTQLVPGKFVVEVYYGRDPAEMTHQFRTVLSLGSMSYIPLEHEGAHMMLRTVDQLEYRRVKS